MKARVVKVSTAAASFALVVAPLLLVSAPGAEAQRLGRLFTSPQDRAELDELRRIAALPVPEPAPEPIPRAQPQPEVENEPQGLDFSRLVINGVVRRSGGPSQVWLNGDLLERGSVSREGVAVESTRSARDGVRLRLPSGAGTVALRPGQQIDIDSGTLLEAYETRAESEAPSAFSPSTSPDTPSVQGGGAQPDPGTSAGPPASAPVPSSADAERALEQLGGSARTDAERDAIEALRERVKRGLEGTAPERR